MTELAALNIKITGDAGDLKAAVSTATAELGKVQAAAATVPRGFNAAAASGGNLAYTMRGVSQQLSQVGQQTMATGQFVQALAIQLPDIGVAFGAVGAAAGLLAGIALPMLVSAFYDTSEKAVALAAATKELASATEAFRISAAALTLGIDQEEVIAVQELNRLLAQRLSLEEHIAKGIKNSKDTTTLQLAAVNALIAPLQKQVDEYRAARDELAKIKANTDAVTTSVGGIVGKAVSAKTALEAMLASAPSGGWLSGAISDAATLASKLWDAAKAKAAFSATGSASVGIPPEPTDLGYSGGVGTANFGGVGSTGGTGGGAGGGANPLAAELEAMQTAMMTQEMAQIESYTRQQETLVAALDQRLITQEEYAAMMQSAELSHANKMGMIKQSESDMVRQAAMAMYGSLEGLLQVFAGKSKAAAIASIALNKGLAIASIIQNTAAAQMKAMFELGPIKGAAAAAKIGMMGKIQAGIVAATGLAQAAGAGGGGGGRAGSVAGPATGAGGAVETRTANINFYGGFQPTQETIGMIATGLNDWLGDGGRLNMGGA